MGTSPFAFAESTRAYNLPPSTINCAPRGASLADFLVVEHGVADVAGGESGAVRQRKRRREIVAQAKDQPMRAIVRRRTEETRHNHACGHRAAHFRVRVAGQREVHVVDDEAARERGGGEACTTVCQMGGQCPEPSAPVGAASAT